MTEYVYRLTTNTPVGAFTGAGGVPDVHHTTGWGNVTELHGVSCARSVASSESDGHTFELTLVEIRENITHDVDALVAGLGIDLLPWQRGLLIRTLEQQRRRSS